MKADEQQPRRNLLVTGGAGFIGVNFVRYWRTAHPADSVVVLDALTYAGNLASLADLLAAPRLRFVHGDICDARLVAAVLEEHDIDTIVHFAAESHVDRSIVTPEAFLRTNVTGTHCLLAAARDLWRGKAESQRRYRFHHVSTDEVYGSLGADEPPFREDTPYRPNSPYAASKAASDHLVRAWHRTYGLPVVGTNCSNNFGPYQYPEKLIPLMLLNALRGRELPVYGDGGNVRDWLYVEDHCRAIDRVLTDGRVGVFYNVGGNNQWTNLELVRTLCAILDRELASDPELARRFPDAPAAHGRSSAELIRFVDDRPGHDRRYAIDATLIERELGFRPAHGFEQSLTRTVRWYLDNESWWRSFLDGTYRDWIARNYDWRARSFA